MKTNIFVYGTLRQSFGNHHLLSHARFVGHAKTESKYVMHASGHIPFVSQSQAIAQIVGEVYEVDAQTLATLDRLEGCGVVSEQPLQFDANSWYTREEVSVRWVDGSETLSAWMYFNEHETRHAIIPTGDFADCSRFLSASDRCWYFAYGSNMNVDRMLERGAPFTQRKRGVMVDHRLVFNKVTSKYPGHGVANVVPERGFEVRGILYEVDRAGIAALDGFEGVRGGHYVRVTLPVAMGDGTSVDAFVYVAHPDRVEEGLTPHEDYFYHLEKGLDLLGEGGAEYLEAARREACVTDDPRFLLEEDLPRFGSEGFEGDVMTKAMPVRINGYNARMILRDDLWSTRLVFACDPSDVPHFRDMGLNVDDDGFFGTKYFHFLRRGILMVGDVRVVVVERYR